MQQMTNILLAKPGLNGAGSSKTLTQDTNSEDFSAALASVSSTSSKAVKSSTSSEMGAASTKVETANEAQPDDEKDINLIFAQIDMASEMKKSLDSLKTRLYQINAKKTCVTPLDKEIVEYLNVNCKGFKAWAKVQKIK